MKVSLLRLGAVVGLSIGALALPTTAFAGPGPLCNPNASGQVTYCRFSGLVAEAGYSASSPTAAQTNVQLLAIRGRSLDAGSGQPTEQSSIMLFVSKYQPNPDPRQKPIILANIFGYLPEAPGFSIDGGLQSASLSPVTVPVSGYDENGPLPADATITVSSDWVGVGVINRSSSDFSFKTGGFILTERANADIRSAQASASALDGTTDWIAGTTQRYADIYTTSDATLTISRS